MYEEPISSFSTRSTMVFPPHQPARRIFAPIMNKNQTDLKSMLWHIRLCDNPEDLHPLSEHLLGDQIQGQHVLGQREVDLQDLFLDTDGILGFIIDQAGDDPVTNEDYFILRYVVILKHHLQLW